MPLLKKIKPANNKQPKFSFEFEVNHKIISHLKIPWDQKWTVSWFIFNNKEMDYVVPNSIIVENQLFLLLKNNDQEHLLLFKNVLILVESEVIIIKICDQVQRFHYQKGDLSKEQKRTLKFAKKQLRIIKRNEVYSLLPNEIFQKHQTIQVINFLEFLMQHKIAIDK